MDVHIAPLADHPELVPTITKWIYGEWGRFDASRDFDHWLASVQRRTVPDRVPTAVVAFADGEPVATASLIEADMDTHPELTPWLADVFVLPEYRGRGLGSAVAQAIMDAAGRIGLKRLYLFTADAQEVYARLGWEEFAREDYHGRDATLMRFEPAGGA